MVMMNDILISRYVEVELLKYMCVYYFFNK